MAAAQRYLAIDPEKVGFTAPFHGVEDTPAGPVPQRDVTPERTVPIPTPVSSGAIYEAYVQLNSALTDELAAVSTSSTAIAR